MITIELEIKTICNWILRFKESVRYTVDHKILLSKLDFCVIRGASHEWLNSYHSERNQITVIDGIITSSSSLISHGAPQGSVLCPLLFLIFIYDLPNSSSLFKFILFADDSTHFDCIWWRKRSGIYINS